MLFQDRSRAESFGDVAEAYDRARPSYPPELFDDLLADGAAHGARRRLRHRNRGRAAGGPRVRRARRRGRRADGHRSRGRRASTVEVGAFEDWDDRGRRVRPARAAARRGTGSTRGVGAPKAADVLQPGGRIGCFWNFGEPPAEFREVMRPVYRRLAPELEDRSVVLGSMTEPLRSGGARGRQIRAFRRRRAAPLSLEQDLHHRRMGRGHRYAQRPPRAAGPAARGAARRGRRGARLARRLIRDGLPNDAGHG